ncbi:hypothetical protein CVT26_003719 [Gymnopilus dilepis]|uniref:HTH CENPB-type domain-containing protein n=1 Tax=Gymnopilus dilepis TaxID=231916 RepID=A0A409YXI4_9AGAR|nr:hypothetical protein CVT26_003719 [Gymnopilus dilepis]
MPGRAKPDDQKQREYVEIQDKWMEEAVNVYREEQEKEAGQKRLGLRAVCEIMEDRCWETDKKVISLDKSTLTRRLKNTQSQAQSNAGKSWLTEGEIDAIIAYANALARDGWPLSRRRIEEHAYEICKAKYGEDFPGFGHNWIDRFMSKHKSRLKGSWSRPLEKSRARAGNPFAKADYFDKLKVGLDGEEEEEPLEIYNLYAADETGFQDGIGEKEWVYGEPSKKFQHQQRSGS